MAVAVAAYSSGLSGAARSSSLLGDQRLEIGLHQRPKGRRQIEVVERFGRLGLVAREHIDQWGRRRTGLVGAATTPDGSSAPASVGWTTSVEGLTVARGDGVVHRGLLEPDRGIATAAVGGPSASLATGS